MENISEMPNKLITKQVGVSYLRIFSTICVIWLHTCSTLCENQQLFILNKTQILFFNTAYQAMYWAVPVFFMITGMLFLRQESHIEEKGWFSKHTRRVLMALFIFGIPYAALKIMISECLDISILGKSILMVISDTGFGHLWYLYVLIGTYSIMPLLKCFCDKTTENEMKFVLIVLFIFDFCFPLISRLTEYKIAFCCQITYPVFYVLMGHWLFEHKDRFKRNKLWIVLFSCVLMIWILNVFGLKADIWTQYDSPLIVILASSVFVLFINREYRNTRHIWGIDRLCFGTYLIHPLFIQFTYRFLKVTPIDFSFYPVMTVLFAIVFISLAFTATWIMRKIGFLRKYVL